MDPLLRRLAHSFDSLQSREAIQRAIDDLEDLFDVFDEMDQEIATRMIEQLNERLERLPK